MHLRLQGINPDVNKRIAQGRGGGTVGGGPGDRLEGGTQEEGSAQLPLVQEERVLYSGPHPIYSPLFSL